MAPSNGVLDYVPILRHPSGARQRGPWLRLLAISRQDGMEGTAYVMPELSASALAANGGIGIRLSVPVGSYVWGFSGWTQQAAGFDVQITDHSYNNTWWPAPIRWDNLTQQGATPEGIQTPLFILPEPRLVIDPGALDIQIRNLAAVPNQVQLVVFVVQPETQNQNAVAMPLAA